MVMLMSIPFACAGNIGDLKPGLLMAVNPSVTDQPPA
jgi:hypothetical protein